MPKPDDPKHLNEPSAAMPINVPEHIGEYHIQRVLGAGGMATVYAALQKHPRRTVALKVMKSGVESDTALRRFKREVEILGKLRHPYIAQVYAAGTHDDASGTSIPYFVMEYVPGARTLLEFVSMHNLELRDRLKLFVKICAAVEHGHRAKVIHRDLKPGNILIDEAGEPKIIDFGVSHTTDLDITAAAGGQTMLTEAGRLVGTLHYMAPEQVDTTRQDLDARCDVYALGVVLYKLTTGRFPVDVEAVPLYEAVRLIREKQPTRPNEVNPAVKGDLETIILKALEKDRLRRYRNAGSLGRDIVRYLAGKPIHGRRAGVLYRSALFVRRHRAASIAAIVVLLTIATACALVIWNRAQLERDAQRILAARPNQPTVHGEGSAAATQAAAAQANESADTAFVLAGHVGRVHGLSFASGGNQLVSAGADGNVIIWSLAQRKAIHTFKLEGGAVQQLAISGDGQFAAFAAADGEVSLVDIAAGKIVKRFGSPCADINAFALDRAGNRIAIACEDFTVRVGDTNGNKMITLRSTTGAFTSCAFDSDGARLVAGTRRGSVHVWTLDSPSDAGSPGVLRMGESAEVAGVSFLAAGDRVSAISSTGETIIWSQANSSLISQFEATNSSLIAATYSTNGNRLACLERDACGVWDLSKSPPKPLGDAIQLQDTATSIAVDNDGSRIALGLLNGDIRVVTAQ